MHLCLMVSESYTISKLIKSSQNSPSKNVIFDSHWGSVFDGEGFTSAERTAYKGASQKKWLRCTNPIAQINSARPDATDTTAHEWQFQKLKPSVIKRCLFTHCHSPRNNIIPDSLPKEGCRRLPAKSLGNRNRRVWYPAGEKLSFRRRRGNNNQVLRHLGLKRNVTAAFQEI